MLFIAITALLFTSCQVSSNINTSRVQAGMTKEEIIAKLGKPYKSSFYVAKDSTLYETLYYKELLTKMSGQSSLISALKFRNNILFSLDQNHEYPIDDYYLPTNEH